MIVARSARRYGPKPALVAGERTLTYQALHDLCDRVAGGLRALGVRPGDRVSLYSPNRWEWVVAYHAALRAGAVVNPINVMLTPEEVAFVPPRPISSSTADRTWPRTSCRAPSGSCPICPRRQPAR
ncbi:MAG TPA: AMP-binding protein [Streptosporangiaceae bacterium]|nr:AMP-binding protein [Streptosporangiaceae bacterium]